MGWQGPFREEWVDHGDRVERHLFQPGRRSILETVQQVRDNRLARKMDWGRVEMEIPELDYMVLTRKYPDLNSPDKEIQKRAWLRLAKGEGQKYLVNGKGRFMARSVGGLDNGGQTGS